jgi:TonB-dependent starch-binding outer membrane protein SusC
MLACIMLQSLNNTMAQSTQTKIIKGVVEDSKGTPLPGVTVTVKSTKIITQTSSDGSFTINAREGDVLLITSVAHLGKETTIGKSSSLKISLSEKVGDLNDVVVVAYGSVKKKDLTGAVSVVNVGDAKKTATYDVAKMLQGQVPGVTVQGSGEPGGYVSIKIRGISSLIAGNDPLFIIDGVPVGAPFDFSPGDIESIQVLKDASSAALYGSRANGGVIIITTKKGKNGPIKINYNGYIGMQKVPKTIPVTDRIGYQTITNEAEKNAGLSLAPGNDPSSPQYIDNVNTDWQKEAFKTGIMQDHNLGVSGGNENISYTASLGYFDQSSTYNGPQNYTRYTFNSNLQGKKGKLTYGAKLAYTQSHKVNPYNSMQYHAVFGGAVTSVLTAIPTMPVYDPNRLRGYGGSDNATQRAITLNVIGMNNVLKDYSDRNRFLGNVWAELEIIKNLKYRINLSYDRTDWNNFHFEPTFDLGWYYLNTKAYMAQGNGRNSTSLIENILTYHYEIGKHRIDVLGGITYQADKGANMTATGSGFSEPYFYNFSLLAPADKNVDNWSGAHNILSYLGRINYNYDDRYLLTVNGRRDGSSNFSPAYRYGNFGSLAAAWNIHNEHFIKLPSYISSLKIRGGYGSLGNENIPYYSYSSYVNAQASYVFGNTLAPGTTTVAKVDQNLKWETTTSTSAGIELGLFNEKIRFTAEYYERKSTDMLYAATIPLSAGSVPSSIITNIASLKNTGLEFTASYHGGKNKFKYDISANLHTLKNTLLKITGVEGEYIDGVGSRSEVGRSVGDIFVYETEGIFQSTEEITKHATQPGAGVGDLKFVDHDGNGIINGDDRVYMGTAIPKVYYGLNITLGYANWDFSLFAQGNAGNKVLNGVYHDLMGGQYSNSHTDELNYWTPTNTNTNVPRPIIGDPNSNGRFSNRFIEDGSYIKLQNFQLGYTVAANTLGALKIVKSLRAYVSGQNVFTVSGYKGYDPDFLNGGLLSRGYDIGSFPNPRTFLIGLQVGF